MRETIELRIWEEFVGQLFREHEGKRAGLVRVIRLDSSDARLAQVAKLESQTRRELGDSFVVACHSHRSYTREELSAAEAIQLLIFRELEPCGEECGTGYDQATACPYCGAGAGAPLRGHRVADRLRSPAITWPK